MRALRRFLEGERWAIYNFLFTVLDLVSSVLSPPPVTVGALPKPPYLASGLGAPFWSHSEKERDALKRRLRGRPGELGMFGAGGELGEVRLQTLTPEQEAALESLAYPFKPDWHTMLCVLELRKTGMPVTAASVAEMALPDLSFAIPGVAQLMPTVTATQLLLRPMTSLGMGVRLHCEQPRLH